MHISGNYHYKNPKGIPTSDNPTRIYNQQLSHGGTRLLIEGDHVHRSEPLASLEWPERTRHGARPITFVMHSFMDAKDVRPAVELRRPLRDSTSMTTASIPRSSSRTTPLPKSRSRSHGPT